MYTEFNLWHNEDNEVYNTAIRYYKPTEKKSDCAVVIFPGGGYYKRAPHEGDGYAQFLSQNGISAFVVDYHIAPDYFPLPLLDARRAVRFVRFNAEKFGIDTNKIAVMGSSAGGHLAALVSTYMDEIDGENVDDIDKCSCIPNVQILCYPVVNLYDKAIAHIGSGDNLTGDNYFESNNSYIRRRLTPSLICDSATPPAFIWHTFEDATVNVKNSLEYAAKLKDCGVDVELHIFPHGRHGLGLTNQSDAVEAHVSQWSGLLLNWLKYIGW